MLSSLLVYCPDDWAYYNEHCYYVSNDTKTHTSARLQCQAWGSTLASISDSSEKDFVASITLVTILSDITVYYFLMRISLHLN